LREELQNELKTELVLDEIAAKQELPVSMQEVEQHYLLMAQVMEQPVEQLVQNVPVANVRTSILQRKAIDLLVEKSTITDENGNPVSMEVAAMEDEADEALGEVDAEQVAALEAESLGADSEFLDEAQSDVSTEDEAPQASTGTVQAL
jgi:trigger factor